MHRILWPPEAEKGGVHAPPGPPPSPPLSNTQQRITSTSAVCVAAMYHQTNSGVRLRASANTADNARCDISAVSVWNPLERAFVDIRVFHAPAPSNRSHKTTARMYRHHEALKKTALTTQESWK